MGTENNECVIATTWNDEIAAAVRDWVDYQSNRGDQYALVESRVNGMYTFFLAPDCSKKGWAESEEGKAERERFIEKIESYNYVDGSSPWSWVEVGYGEYGQKILRGNCRNKYSDKEYATDE
jgi:hypothetical protein